MGSQGTGVAVGSSSREDAIPIGKSLHLQVLDSVPLPSGLRILGKCLNSHFPIYKWE